MTTADVVSTIFALLLAAGVIGVVAALLHPTPRLLLARYGLRAAAVVAASATLGSLYFSEIAGFFPCELCWFQRIFMYPLGVVLPIAAWRDDKNIVRYAVPLGLIGLAISIYHIQIQLFPDQGTSCDISSPCTTRWVEALGFATIPQMAGSSFALIVATLILSNRFRRAGGDNRTTAFPEAQPVTVPHAR